MARGKVTMFLALVIAVTLVLGAELRDAQAEICKKIGERNGCVVSGDVEDQSLEIRNLKNEAGASLPSGIINAKTLGATDRELATTRIKPPKNKKNKGFAVVTAALQIKSDAGSEEGSVRCEILVSKVKGKIIARKPFYDSVAGKNDILESSVSATVGLRVRKGGLRARLLCRRLSGGNVSAEGADLVVQFFPTRY